MSALRSWLLAQHQFDVDGLDSTSQNRGVHCLHEIELQKLDSPRVEHALSILLQELSAHAPAAKRASDYFSIPCCHGSGSLTESLVQQARTRARDCSPASAATALDSQSAPLEKCQTA